MARPYILPLGFIDRAAENGTVFHLANPDDARTIGPGTPVTVWRYSPEHLALAKLYGKVTDVGYTTATFITAQTETDPRWPGGVPIIRKNTPVYLALDNSFEPDQSRMLTQNQADTLRNLSQKYRSLRKNHSGPSGKDRHAG